MLEIQLKREKTAFFVVASVIFLIISFILRIIGFADTYLGLMGIAWTIFITCVVLLLSSKFNVYKWRLYIKSAYLVRVFLLYFNVLTNNFVDTFFKNVDYITFLDVAHDYYNGDFSFIWTNYPRILYLQYQLFGENEYIVRLINVFLSILAIMVVCKILEYLKLRDKIASWIVWIVCFLPYPCIGSIFILREPMYIFFCTLSLYYFLKYIDKKNLIDFMLAILLAFIPIYLHSGHIVVLMAYFTIYVLYGKDNKASILNLRLLIGACVGLLGVLLIVKGFGGDYLKIGTNGILGGIQTIFKKAFKNGGGSFYLKWMQAPDSLLAVGLYTPIRIIYFLISPLPMDFRGIVDVIAFVGDSSIHLIALVCFFVYCFGREKKNKVEWIFVLTIFLIMIFTASVFGWGTFTTGTAIRHREFMLYMECILIAIFFNNGKRVKDKKEYINV